jgi:hypothetical protein
LGNVKIRLARQNEEREKTMAIMPLKYEQKWLAWSVEGYKDILTFGKIKVKRMT